MGKPDGKVAVITGGSSDMALAGAKLFVDEGALTSSSRAWRQDALDGAVKLIVRNVTGAQADSANLDDLDRSFDAVRQERAPSTCCGIVPGRPRKPSAARSPSNTSMPPSG
jgi:NAD(P)-dependent dehydrogenase (short-subunit alcohol dehydrogenase family)